MTCGSSITSVAYHQLLCKIKLRKKLENVRVHPVLENYISLCKPFVSVRYINVFGMCVHVLAGNGKYVFYLGSQQRSDFGVQQVW